MVILSSFLHLSYTYWTNFIALSCIFFLYIFKCMGIEVRSIDQNFSISGESWCKTVNNRRQIVLTSLQGAWHNHGQKTHCMVRSSTMESWAKTKNTNTDDRTQLSTRHPMDLKSYWVLEINVSWRRKPVKQNTSYHVRQTWKIDMIKVFSGSLQLNSPVIQWHLQSKSRSPKVWANGAKVTIGLNNN